MNVIKSGGVEIAGLDSSKVARRKHIQNDPVLETYEFVPYETSASDDSNLGTWLSAAVQIILQNVQGFLKTVKICTVSGSDSKLIDDIKQILDAQPMVETQYVKYDESDTKTVDAVVLTEPLEKDVDVNGIVKRLNETGMILYQGDISKLTLEDVNVVYKATFGKTGIHLLRPNREFPSKHSVVYVKNSDFGWLDKVKNLVQTHSKEVVFLVSQSEDTSGLVGLVKCLLTEPVGPQFKCVLIKDKEAAAFSLGDDFYRGQLGRGLTFNVLREGKWGTFAHLPLRPIERKEVEDAAVSVLTVGDLSTLSWVQKSPNYVT